MKRGNKTFLLLSILILLSVVLFTYSAVLHADSAGKEAASNVTTVKSVAKMKDDSKVKLEGHIIKKLASEHFLFKDATGRIEIEIDDEDFGGIIVKPEIKIRIIGEVDRDSTSTTIDVDYLEVVE